MSINTELVDPDDLTIYPNAIPLNDYAKIYLPVFLVQIGLYDDVRDAREAVWKRL